MKLKRYPLEVRIISSRVDLAPPLLWRDALERKLSGAARRFKESGIKPLTWRRWKVS
jgi:hypothetical protein